MTDEELQAVYDDIPAHSHQPMTVRFADQTLTMRGSLDARNARAPGMDQVHGGVAAALLDTAATVVLAASVGGSWTTVDLRIDYLRPIRLGECSVTASVVRAGRRVARSTAELFDGNLTLCATATGTFVTA